METPPSYEINNAKQTELSRWERAVPTVVLQCLNTVFYALMVLMFFLEAFGVLGSVQISANDERYTPFDPASYAFAIWLVIYVLQGAFVVYQLTARFRQDPDYEYFLRRAHIFLALNFLAESIWFYLVSNDKELSSAFFIWLMWVVLAFAFFRLNASSPIDLWSLWSRRGNNLLDHVNPHQDTRKSLTIVYFTLYLPTALNFGWISIASLLNLFASIDSAHPLSNGVAAGFLIGGVAILTVVSAISLSIPYGLVFIWGYIAILVNEPQDAASTQPQVHRALIASICFIFVVWFATIGTNIRQHRARLSSSS